MHTRELRFVIIGGLNTLFGTAVYALLYYMFRGMWSVTYIYLFATAIAILEGFITHKYLVWKSSGPWQSEMKKFFSVNTLFVIINVVAIEIFVKGMGFNPILIQVLTSGATTFASYFIHRFWTFNLRKTSGFGN